ncbi:hypothetical protein V493_04859 [Pseudogymnoascus sp. VKM F-4281 (FW-2241)]|nr:hypothetical protein V493_04859 [Pseudogymnoascus sp. VKM F-4281 (FW-2241)]
MTNKCENDHSETLYAQKTNPIINLLALEGIKAFAEPPDYRKVALRSDVFPESNGDAVRGLNVLLTKIGVKTGLKDFGFKEGDIDKAADIAVSNPYYNPRPIERYLVQEVIRRAWAGEEAKADL